MIPIVAYLLLFAGFVEGAQRLGEVSGKWAILSSAIVGACIALWIIYTWAIPNWQWAFLGLIFLLGGSADIAGNLLWHKCIGWHYLARSGWIGLANLGMLSAALAVGVMVSKGLRRVSYIALAAILGSLADVVSVSAGPTRHLVQTDAVYFLSFQWGIIGEQGIKPIVGMGDFIFLALFFAGAHRFGWDTRRTFAAMAIALIIGFCLTLLGGVGLPALPFFAVALGVAHWKDLQLSRREWAQVMQVVFIFALLLAAFVLVRKIG